MKAPDDWLPEIADIAARYYGISLDRERDLTRQLADEAYFAQLDPQQTKEKRAELQRRLDDTQADTARIRRLGTDTRLCPFWAAIPRKDDKLNRIFWSACSKPWPVLTRKEFDAWVDDWTRLAAELRRAANYFPGFQQHHRQALREAADELEDKAKRPRSRGPWVVDKQKKDLSVRGYVVELSEEFQWIFGEPRDKFVAMIGTVALALEEELSPRTVFSWRTYSGKQNSET
jgi:hypothetical protein